MFGLFDDVPKGPEDPMNLLLESCNNDSSPEKVDVGAGVYRGTDGSKPYVLSAIKRAKKILCENDPGHEYITTTGDPIFTAGAAKLLFGVESPALRERRVATTQTTSGTSANHIGAAFARNFFPSPHTVFVGMPAWGNYKPLFEHVGFKVIPYNYYDLKTHSVDFESVITTANNAPKGSLFVLQGCCHNPTGADLSKDQWIKLAAIMREKELIPFFDVAYQGLGQGMDEDAWSARYFVEAGFEMIVCQSFSKHMGLYSERVGCCHIVTRNENAASCVLDQLRCLVRWEFSSSPAYGSRLATIIMQSDDLYNDWQNEVIEMRTRMRTCRKELHNLLTKKYQTPGSWDNILYENGLFHYSGLTPEQVRKLWERHIYLPATGRVNVAGLNPISLPVFASAINEVVREV